jgi:hypothetical protein
MIKSFTALTIFALLGASVIALPGFAPEVEASEAPLLAKADRLQVRLVTESRSNEVWPNLPVSCLQILTKRKIAEARLVKTSR